MSTAAPPSPPQRTSAAGSTRRDVLAAGAALAALPVVAARNAVAATDNSAVAAPVQSVAPPDVAAAGVNWRGHWRNHWRDYWRCRFGDLHVQVWAPPPAARRRPPLVCLHQNPRSAQDFARLAPWLATDRAVCAIDSPGCGASDPPPAPVSITALALALEEALADPAAPIDAGPVDLFGQHTGAAIALELAALRPARVRRLALIGIPFVPLAEREQWLTRFAQPRPWVSDPAYLAAQWQRSLEVGRGLGLVDAELLARFADALRAAPYSAWGFDAVFRYPFEQRLPLVRPPTLVIVVNELIAPNSRAAAALLGAGRILEMPLLDGRALDIAPEPLAAALRAFLDA